LSCIAEGTVSDIQYNATVKLVQFQSHNSYWSAISNISVTDTYNNRQPFNGLFSRTTWVSRYQKGKTNLDFTGARDSEWHGISWAICKSAPRSRQDNHSVFYSPSCRPTNSVKALKAQSRVTDGSSKLVRQKQYS